MIKLFLSRRRLEKVICDRLELKQHGIPADPFPQRKVSSVVVVDHPPLRHHPRRRGTSEITHFEHRAEYKA